MTLVSSEFAEATDGLAEYGLVVKNLIQQLTSDAGIQIQVVDHRVKSEESASKKVTSSPDKYTGIGDLTDLLGLRVITYFAKDVYKVADLIERHFAVDAPNSMDKKEDLDPEKFGYLSVHYVASLKGERLKLPEYKMFKGKRFEVQIRTVLQHAWAEIEHDLGYKAEKSTPKDVRRRFARIAGIFELADEEFDRLRSEILIYEERVSKTIDKAPETLRIDQSTVAAALKTEKALIDLDLAVTGVTQRSLATPIETKYIANRANDMMSLGLSDINELLQFATKYHNDVKQFASLWINERKAGDSQAASSHLSFPRGIGLFYLAYILAAQKEDSELKDWAKVLRRHNPGLLKRVRSTYKRINKNDN